MTLEGHITRPSIEVELAVGAPVGEYEIQGRLGEGAMGTVYAAIHPVIGKRVAIKVLKKELCANPAHLDRFIQEAQAVNQIGHPNIVDVFALGELPGDGRAYFVMEWLRGEDLKARLARGPINAADSCDVLDGIARALDAAHAKGIVHRDLKPENVFLHEIDSGSQMVKLLDFGIAKLLRTATKEKTQTGNLLGTPRYIAPEQARGVDVDHRADIYSLGVMAYEMLAGRAPFEGETAMDLVVAHMNATPPPLASFAKLPRPLEQTVMRMLAKDPAKRPSIAEIRTVLGDPTRRLTMQAIPQPPRRGMRWLALAGVGLLAASAITWKLTSGGTSEPVAPIVVTAPVVVEAPPPPPAAVVSPPVVIDHAKLVIDVDGATNADILVDGERWARGSSATGEATIGKHVIEVAGVTREVTVVAGVVTTITIVVKRAPIAKPPIAKPPVAKPEATSDEDIILKPKGH